VAQCFSAAISLTKIFKPSLQGQNLILGVRSRTRLPTPAPKRRNSAAPDVSPGVSSNKRTRVPKTLPMVLAFE
jgi:hypothetical protein